MNRGIQVLRRELERLNDLGRSATVETYKPERVERAINACCKEHRLWRGKQGTCRYEALCTRLWDRWSEEAPISYSPAVIDRLIIRARTQGVEWLPRPSEDLMAELKQLLGYELYPFWILRMTPEPPRGTQE